MASRSLPKPDSSVHLGTSPLQAYFAPLRKPRHGKQRNAMLPPSLDVPLEAACANSSAAPPTLAPPPPQGNRNRIATSAPHSSTPGFVSTASPLNPHTAVAGLFFLDRLERKNLTVWLGAFHYLPIIAMTLSVTVNCFLHVFFSLIFPLLDSGTISGDAAAGTTSPSGDASTVTLTSALAFVSVLRPVFGHAGVFVGVCVLGYKAMCVMLDAMIDSCLYVVDPRTHVLIPFYGLLHDMRQVFRQRVPVRVVFVGVLLAHVFAVRQVYALEAFSSNWSPTDSTMFRCCTAFFLVALFSLMCSYYSNVVAASTDSVAPAASSRASSDAVSMEWWARVIPRARRRVTYAILIVSAYVFLGGGGTLGMLSLSEGMLYLVTPHLLLSVSLKITLFLVRVVATVKALVADEPNLRRMALMLILPLVGLVAASAWYFSLLYLVALQAPMLVLALVTLKSHLDLVGNDVQTVALRLYFCNTRHLRRNNMPHFKVSILVRVVLRSLLAAALFLVVTLGMWVSLQEAGIVVADATGTRCRAVDGEDHIRVETSFMVADLYGLPSTFPLDPKTLLYEPHDFLYDPTRYHGLCSRQWPGDLHAADLAYFSMMAYLPPSSNDFAVSLSFYQRFRVGGSAWAQVPIPSAFRRTWSVPFVHFRSAKHGGVSVIAIRGTDMSAPHDFLQNIFVFAEPAIFNVLGSLVPLGAFISDRVKADFFAVSSAFGSLLFAQDLLRSHADSRYFHLQLEEYLSTHVPPSDAVVLTGHSLGGTVAQIVAARQRKTALAFSSPGIGLSYRKFGVPAHAVDAYTTNVVVSNDVIPLVERFSGTVHHVQCEHTRGQVCHSIELHAIRMWSMCPQYRQMVYVNGSYEVFPQAQVAMVQELSTWGWEALLTGISSWGLKVTR